MNNFELLNNDYVKIKEVAEFSLNLRDYAEEYIELKRREGFESGLIISGNKIIVSSKKHIKYIKPMKVLTKEEKEKIEKDIQRYNRKSKLKKKLSMEEEVRKSREKSMPQFKNIFKDEG